MNPGHWHPFFSFIPVTFFIAIPLLKVHLHCRKGMPCCFSFHASPSFHCEDSTSQNHIFPAGYIQKRACLQQGRSLHGKILHGNHLNESVSVTNTCPSGTPFPTPFSCLPPDQLFSFHTVQICLKCTAAIYWRKHLSHPAFIIRYQLSCTGGSIYRNCQAISGRTQYGHPASAAGFPCLKQMP